MKRICLMGLLAMAVPAALAQAPAQPPALKTEQVAPSIYVLFGNGGNIGVSVGADGVLLVDDLFAPVVPQIEEAIRALSPGPVRFILNTHWHGDHTGGNESLAGKGAAIVAHDNVRTRISTDQVNAFLGMKVPALPTGAWPVLTFNEEVNFFLNGEQIHVWHVADAHTDGDALVQFRKANVIHAGDIFFNGLYPFIDRDSGGTIAGMLRGIDAVLAVSDDATRIIPGHGPVATRKDLQNYRTMLAETAGRMRRLVQDGRTLEEVLAAKPNADYDASWSWPFITGELYLKMLYGLVRAELN